MGLRQRASRGPGGALGRVTAAKALPWLLLPLFVMQLPGSSGQLPKSCKVNLTGGLKRAHFPRSFVWGTATSAYQIEGGAALDGRGPSIWDTFSRKQENIADGTNGNVAADSYHRYPEDIKAMKAMGMQSYRFSISWSRIYPRGSGRINLKGVAYYNRLINALVRAGITPAVTLYHWDLPQALQNKYGGWLSRRSVRDFTVFAQTCFRLFGNRVKTWITFNEPGLVVVQGFGTGSMPPARCTTCGSGNSATEPYVVAKHLLLAHAAAVGIYRKLYHKRQKGKIGITLESTYYYPLNPKSPEDWQAANHGMEFNIGWYADPVVYGRYPAIMKQRLGARLPDFTPAESRLLKGSVDFIGINSYTASYATKPNPSPPASQADPYSDRPANPTTFKNGVPLGVPCASSWLRVFPPAIYSMLKWYTVRYPGIPLMVTENGVSQPNNMTKEQTLCDSQRVAFFQSYLSSVLRAIKEGAPVRAYYSWSLLDNFEWLAGYTQRFGIYYVDFASPSKRRTPKASAVWWSRFMRFK